MRLRSLLSCALLCSTTVAFSQQKAAMTPPMGWNSWNHFAERVTDADVRLAADQLVSTGMRDAGYMIRERVMGIGNFHVLLAFQ